MEALKPLAQHWTVVLLTEAPRDVNTALGVNAEKVAVVRKVMDRAEGEPVNHRRDPFWRRVSHDMGSLNELSLAKSADGAAMLIGPQDFVSETLLVEACFYQA